MYRRECGLRFGLTQSKRGAFLRSPLFMTGWRIGSAWALLE